MSPDTLRRQVPATIALCVWTVLVWTTRILNILGDDDLGSGQKFGRTLLALSFTGLALAVGHAVYRRADWETNIVRSLAIWTTGVWVVRSLGIVTGDHDAAFVAVHLVLAAISIGLAYLAVQEHAEQRP